SGDGTLIAEIDHEQAFEVVLVEEVDECNALLVLGAAPIYEDSSAGPNGIHGVTIIVDKVNDTVSRSAGDPGVIADFGNDPFFYMYCGAFVPAAPGMHLVFITYLDDNG